MTNSLLTRLHLRPRPGPARALVAAPFALLAVYLVARGWLYPLWPDTIGALGHPFTGDARLGGAWGGPSLAGAWAVHATIAIAIQAVCLAVLQASYPPAK
jgi:hypothetical protein